MPPVASPRHLAPPRDGSAPNGGTSAPTSSSAVESQVASESSPGGGLHRRLQPPDRGCARRFTGGAQHAVAAPHAVGLRTGLQLRRPGQRKPESEPSGGRLPVPRLGACRRLQHRRRSEGIFGRDDGATRGARRLRRRGEQASAFDTRRVRVGWLDSAIAANRTLVGPGQAITVTATSTFDVQKSGRWLEIYDLSAGARVTYCSRGTVCTTTMKQTTGGVHQIVGYITGKPEAVSMPVNVTWLRVSLAATSIGPKSGGTVNLRATANADLSGTPWVLGIYDQNGNLVY